MIIALYLVAACVGLLIGFTLWFAVRLHAAENAVATHIELLFDSGVKRDELEAQINRIWDVHGSHLEQQYVQLDTLKRAVDEQLSVTIKTAQRVNAHSRYMRTALAAGEKWANAHEGQLGRLHQVGHSHRGMKR